MEPLCFLDSGRNATSLFQSLSVASGFKNSRFVCHGDMDFLCLHAACNCMDLRFCMSLMKFGFCLRTNSSDMGNNSDMDFETLVQKLIQVNRSTNATTWSESCDKSEGCGSIYA